MISHSPQPATAMRPRTPWTRIELEIGPAPTAADAAPTAMNPPPATLARTCGATVVPAEEALDRAGLSRLRERCQAEAAAGATTIVIDFEMMGSCCSAAFVTLQQINTMLRGGGTQLRLVGLEAALRRAVGVD